MKITNNTIEFDNSWIEKRNKIYSKKSNQEVSSTLLTRFFLPPFIMK